MKHSLMQFKFYRRLKKGTFYLIQPNLPMNSFWSDTKITSCQSRILKIETWT